MDFLVDSGSAVTAISRPFFNRLSEAGAPVGMLRPPTRKLRGANGSQIEISGCSYCMVSFFGFENGVSCACVRLKHGCYILELTHWDPYCLTPWT